MPSGRSCSLATITGVSPWLQRSSTWGRGGVSVREDSAIGRARDDKEARQASTTTADTEIWGFADSPWVAAGMHKASTEQPASRLSRLALGLRRTASDLVGNAIIPPAALRAQTIL